MSEPAALSPLTAGSAKDKEQEFVHQVYEEIASHFSQTRYKVSFMSRRDQVEVLMNLAMARSRTVFAGPESRERRTWYWLW